MKNRKWSSPIIYVLELVGLAVLVAAAWLVLKPMESSTTSAVAGSNLAATPTLSAAQGTATRAEWARRQTEVPPVENIWLITPKPGGTARPTWPPGKAVTPPPPRTLVPESPRAVLRTSSVSVGPVREVTIADRSLLVSQILPLSLHTDGKTLVGSVSPARGRLTVVALDMASGQMRALADNTEGMGGPRVSDRYVVWSDNRKLQVYDLQQGQKRELGLDAFEVQIAGSRIIYRAIENGEWHIKGYDLVAQKAFSVADDPGTHSAPLASKNWVVYRLAPKETTVSGAYYYSTTLTALNLDTREYIQLGQIRASSRQAMPEGLFAIDAPWVAWATGQFGDATLHLYNLQTRGTLTVSVPLCEAQTGDSGFVSNLRLSNGIVVLKCGVRPWQYLGYEIQQKVFFSIPIQQPTMEGDELGGWMLVGDRIIWVWNPYENGKRVSHIYTAQILRQSPPYP
jgi:hypothetical protein